MAVIVSNKVANEHIIKAAGFNNKKLVSKPRAYLVHKIVNSINAHPEGSPPKRNESPKETPKIHNTSVNGMLKLE